MILDIIPFEYDALSDSKFMDEIISLRQLVQKRGNCFIGGLCFDLPCRTYLPQYSTHHYRDSMAHFCCFI